MAAGAPTMKQQVRTFVAVEIDSEVRRAAADLVRELSSSGAGVKWVDMDNMHLTLKFLGDVDMRDMAEVCRTVQDAAANVAAFDFTIAGAGAFPTIDRPRTVWLGVAEGAERLIALQDQIDRALKKIGYPAEARGFKPHLTLGRVKRPGPELAELTASLKNWADFEVGRTRIGHVTVFSSQLAPEGPIYHVLASAPLGGRKGENR